MGRRVELTIFEAFVQRLIEIQSRKKESRRRSGHVDRREVHVQIFNTIDAASCYVRSSIRKDFSGIENVIRIECSFERSHHLKLGR